MSDERTYNVLVIGGGINGLATLYHLSSRPGLRIGLVERFRVGHDRGSSHGRSRITRSTYHAADYVRLMQIARSEEWPRLECDAGQTLVHPCPGCFFGPPGQTMQEYAEAVRSAGSGVETLDVETARKRFPQFRFDRVDSVLLDNTAGVVAADEAVLALYRICRQRGVMMHEHVRVHQIHLEQQPIAVDTDHGPFRAERLVVTAGAWAGELIRPLRTKLTVTRQTVGYFRMAGPAGDYQRGRFPVWVYLADSENEKFYGLPEFAGSGIKIARHRTCGPGDDPEVVPEHFAPAAIKDLRAFIEAHLAMPAIELLHVEHCLYTNTASEDFVLDLHPANPRIAIGSACSGHAFKFGPLTGRILAEMVLDGRTSIAEFEACRQRFAFPRS